MGGLIILGLMCWTMGAGITIMAMGDSKALPTTTPGTILVLILWPLFWLALPGFLLMKALMWMVGDSE